MNDKSTYLLQEELAPKLSEGLLDFKDLHFQYGHIFDK